MKNFINYWNRLTIQIFHQVSSMNCIKISELAGEEFYCTSSDMTKALNVSENEINRLIEESREELAAVGENPDDYFETMESTRFVM